MSRRGLQLIVVVLTAGLGLETVALLKTRAHVREAERYAASALSSWEWACTSAAVALKNGGDIPPTMIRHCLPSDLAETAWKMIENWNKAGASALILERAQKHVLPDIMGADDAEGAPLPAGYSRL